MQKKIAVVQSNYIPWKGYFDLIRSVDAFILYDDVQYTRSDWRNRNKIKTAQGEHWLSIAVKKKGRLGQLINEVQVSSPDWAAAHWKTIEQSYRRAPCFAQMEAPIRALYEQAAGLQPPDPYQPPVYCRLVPPAGDPHTAVPFRGPGRCGGQE